MKSEKPAPKPIPTHISGLAYITKSGYIRYARSGRDLDLPKDFKQWHIAVKVPVN